MFSWLGDRNSLQIEGGPRKIVMIGRGDLVEFSVPSSRKTIEENKGNLGRRLVSACPVYSKEEGMDIA
jgi:hypothetical protein